MLGVFEWITACGGLWSNVQSSRKHFKVFQMANLACAKWNAYFHEKFHKIVVAPVWVLHVALVSHRRKFKAID